MSKQELIELINKEIDGVNSSDDSRRLTRGLGEHPECALYYEDMKKLAVALGTAEQRPVPVNLKKRVMNSLPGPDALPRRRSAPVRFPVHLHFLQFKYSYTFGAGIICGLAIYFIVTLSRPEAALIPSQAYGTMSEMETIEKVAPSSTAEITFDNASGRLTLKQMQDHLLLDIALRTKQEIRMELSYNGNDLQVNGVVQSTGQQHSFNVGQSSVRFMSDGDASYRVMLQSINHRSSPLKVAFYDGEKLLAERTLSLNVMTQKNTQ